ncbi:keratin [Spirulina subsalsa FACHB-351]|uniref:Keratin n=1 Tax=Spirulina subsalsa FACHB-351 TaxID=234711 RepID=A0ABT3LAS3_9CYAN|nr:keratin [Spirulina subsalsa]MCW6038609.1 keratin [Spirulina subsalsa FACHB-351]
MSELIALDHLYAPSLYWFTYRYHSGLIAATDRTPSNPTLADLSWVQQQYQQVFSALGVEGELGSTWQNYQESNKNCDLLKNPELESGRQYEDFAIPDKNLEGFIYPQSLHDAYGLNLNLYYPENPGGDRLPIAELNQFNPQACFKPPTTPPFGYLGQTLLLTAYLDIPRPANLRDLEPSAHQCWQQFFKLETLEPLPRLYRAAEFWGGYLYEYGNPEDDLTVNPYGHLMIWFFFDGNTSSILERCYWELPELLLYYHKIAWSFCESRHDYEKADQIVNQNESKLETFNTQYLQNQDNAVLTATEITELKITLKSLLKTSLSYSQQLRNLEYARNTIAINHRNYLAILDQMEQLAQTPLEALRVFGEKEAVTFQDQITADLNYFRHGSGLLDTAIASIRGLVEIDQAERDRHLQDEIQAIGVGIATGAILASSAGLLTQRWHWPSRDRLLPPHPFLIAVLGSSVIALLTWRWMKHILNQRRCLKR